MFQFQHLQSPLFHSYQYQTLPFYLLYLAWTPPPQGCPSCQAALIGQSRNAIFYNLTCKKKIPPWPSLFLSKKQKTSTNNSCCFFVKYRLASPWKCIEKSIENTKYICIHLAHVVTNTTWRWGS